MLPSAESIQIVLPVLSILLLLMGFFRSIYGVLAYFIILNAKLGDMYPVLGAVRFELLAAIVVLVSILFSGNRLDRAFVRTNDLNKRFWLLIAVGMLSVVQAVDIQVSWDNGGYNLLKLVCFYVMVVASIQDEKDLRLMVWGFVLMSAWIAYEPVVNFLQGDTTDHGYGAVASGRFGAATGHVALANTLSQAVPLTYFFARAEPIKWKRILLWSILGFLVCGIVFTKSRGGFVGLIAIAAGIVITARQRGKAAVAMLLLFVCLLPFAGAEFTSRIATIGDGVFASRTSTDRYLGLVNGLSMMVKRPVLGVGVGTYAEARRQYFSYYFYAHNLYGELFGELGLASIFWFLWIWTLFRRSQQIKINCRQEGERGPPNFYINLLNGVQVGLFTRLVIGNFSHCAFIWFWFLMAAFVVATDQLTGEKIAQQQEKEFPKKGIACTNVL